MIPLLFLLTWLPTDSNIYILYLYLCFSDTLFEEEEGLGENLIWNFESGQPRLEKQEKGFMFLVNPYPEKPFLKSIGGNFKHLKINHAKNIIIPDTDGIIKTIINILRHFIYIEQSI